MGRERYTDPGRTGILFAVLVIAALALVVPAGAATITINPGQSIQAAITAAGSDGTVILNPGTYTQHSITVGNNIRLQANTSYGHGPLDTVIDGQYAGDSILRDDGGYSLTIDNLTLQNGMNTGTVSVAEGGAIFARNANITITSAIFNECSVKEDSSSVSWDSSGGAILVNSGTLTVISSTFNGCSVSGIGHNGNRGGAISLWGSDATITSSAFNGCSVTGPVGFGGAIFTENYGNNHLIITSSTFTGCLADGFEYGAGGAIFAGYNGPHIITSSTFTGCSATNNGGAIYSSPASLVDLHFSRIYGNNGETAVAGNGNIENNWWGTNAGPAGYTSGSSDSSPWLVLGATASPATLSTNRLSTIRANLTFNSDGTDTSSLGRVPDDIPVSFSGTGSGTVFSGKGITAAGTAQTLFTPASAGSASVTATVDGQSVTIPITVTGPGIAATSIVIDPDMASTIYAGLDGYGIYTSTDGGTSWTAAGTQPGNTHIRSLVINPADHAELFAATYGGGVYRSRDHGASWTGCSPASLASLDVTSLVTSSTGTLYASTGAGVFASTDGCDSWTAMNPGLP